MNEEWTKKSCGHIALPAHSSFVHCYGQVLGSNLQRDIKEPPLLHPAPLPAHPSIVPCHDQVLGSNLQRAVKEPSPPTPGSSACTLKFVLCYDQVLGDSQFQEQLSIPLVMIDLRKGLQCRFM